MTNEEYLKATIKALGEPMPYQWKVQSYNKKDRKEATKAICVAYIDARDVTKRLNECCAHGWHRDHFALGDDKYCKIGIVMPDSSIIWRADVGDSGNDTETSKTAASDSFKRAAVQFGVGLFLYGIDPVTLDVKQEGGYTNIVDDKGVKIWDLTKHINSTKDKPKAKAKAAAPAQPSIVPALPELKPDTDNFKYVAKRIKEGVPLDTIKKTFTITKEIEEQLTKDTK